MRLSLCILTWNEIHGCKHDIPLLPLDDYDEVFAIDAGSTDGTVEYLQERGIQVYKQDAPGYNAAYISAFRRCSTDALVMFHPKGSIDPQVVRQFPPYFKEGYDLVIASRNMKGGGNEEDSQILRPRKWFVWFIALLAYAMWRREGPFICDVLHGCRGMRKDAFYAIDAMADGVSIDLEMVVRAYRLRLKRIEFPVKELARLHGKTHFKAWPTGKRLIKYLWHECTRKMAAK